MRILVTILLLTLGVVGVSRMGYCPAPAPLSDEWVAKCYTNQWQIYRDSVAYRESRRDTLAVGLNYYRGIYQFGRQAARDVGVDYDKLFTLRESDTALVRYSKKNWEYLKAYHHYVGDTINGIPITKAGMLFAAHLRGHIYAAKFLSSRGKTIGRDANGVVVDEYYRVMSRVFIK